MFVPVSTKLKIRVSFFGAFFFWILFAGSSLYLVFLKSNGIKEDISDIMPQISFTLFIVASYTFFRHVIKKADSVHFTDLLWRVFVTGLITTIVSLAIRGFFYLFSNSSIVENALTVNFFYNILVGAVTIFTTSTFVAWNRFILYQKTKSVTQLWAFFEMALLGVLFFDIFGSEVFSPAFNFASLLLAIFSLVLSFNLKWVAYLNFKQKWKGILFIVLSSIYLYHFYLNLQNFSLSEAIIINLLDRAFIWGLLFFLTIYAVISVLVTVFNLPTSSVFEQKLKEAIDFQRLSRSVPKGETTDQTYALLLDSAMNAVFADAAWLEIKDENGKRQIIRNLEDEEVDEIKSKIKDENILQIIRLDYQRDLNPSKLGNLKHSRFKSLIALPIQVQETQVGYMMLLNDLRDAFNKEMIQIVTTYVNQASVSLENLSLIKESIANERYKEELKIAKAVQKSLLPTSLIDNDYLTIEAISMAADEVGGDYYDILEYEKNRFALIIGDVSGKGTSAAFQMAQMKGMFHSLCRQGLSPKAFISKINMALSHCLNSSSFITAIYFDIDVKSKMLNFSRAGHCPALIHCVKNDVVYFLEADGMGLGILRNSSYDKYVYERQTGYGEGDTLLLYTDGITEAKNQNGVLFGEERLLKSFEKHRSKAPYQLKMGIIEDIANFTGEIDIDDDYTLVIVKFKKGSND